MEKNISFCMIPGWGFSTSVFDDLCTRLQSTRLPTAGHAQPEFHFLELPESGSNLSTQTQALSVQLQAQPGKTILCGWSLGALLALDLARHFPEKIVALVLLSATPCFVNQSDWTHGLPATDFAAFKKSFVDTPESGPELELQRKRFISLFNQGDQQAKALSRRLLPHLSPVSKHGLLAGLQVLETSDLRNGIHAIHQPALLIHGEADPLMPLAAARWLEQNLPQARLETLPDTAHAPLVAEPEVLAGWINGFVDTLRID